MPNLMTPIFALSGSTSPVRHTLMSGAAIALALTFAFIAVDSYAQDSQLEEPETAPAKALESEIAPVEPALTPQDEPADTEGLMPMPETQELKIAPKMEPPATHESPETMMADCPEGTEAQSDNSCVVIGDWEPMFDPDRQDPSDLSPDVDPKDAQQELVEPERMNGTDE